MLKTMMSGRLRIVQQNVTVNLEELIELQQENDGAMTNSP